MKKVHVMIATTIAAIVLGSALLVILMVCDNQFIKNVTLEANGTTYEKLEYYATGIAPGESREYTINLFSKVDGNYDLELAFSEEGDSPLKEFVNVVVTCGDQQEEYTLKELFKGQKINFTCRMGLKHDGAIIVKFVLPADVGDEAQGAVADFVIKLTAER